MQSKVTEFARLLASQRQEHADLADRLKTMAETRDETEKLLIDAMVDDGIRSVDVEGLGLFSLTTKNYLSVNVANKPGFYEYLQESGNGALLKLDVNPRTLTAFLREHLDLLVKERVSHNGESEVDARNTALEFLNKKGASYFSERGISVRKNS